jgi:hypothetical protein
MMYYRIAWKNNQSAVWQWKSTKLSSLNIVFRWFMTYHTIPQNQLRVFSSPSGEDWGELLRCQNTGEATSSVAATHFLHERGIHGGERAGQVPEQGEQRTRETQEREVIAVARTSSLHQSSRQTQPLGDWSTSLLENRWAEREPGAGGQTTETIIPDSDSLAQYGFTPEESVSLLRLRQRYQTGGSDRVALLHHWEFLKHLIRKGLLEL